MSTIISTSQYSSLFTVPHCEDKKALQVSLAGLLMSKPDRQASAVLLENQPLLFRVRKDKHQNIHIALFQLVFIPRMY